MSSSRDDRNQSPEKPRALQDKEDPNPRPDRPTTSDDATLVERGSGAHAEFSTAPETFADGPPPDAADDEDADEDEGPDVEER